MLVTMSEMLGNQYFLAKRYSDAYAELEAELNKDTANRKSISKKLIICYLQTDQLDKAFDMFYSVVTRSVNVITDTNPEKDGCPCPEIINENLPRLKYNNDLEQNLKMGILWLYCDAHKSIDYFDKIQPNNKYSERVKEIIEVLKSHTIKIN